MTIVKILWVDDEVDLLRPHILFLEQKGYTIHTVNNGRDAIDQVRQNFFDIVFLDENMPGLSGLQVLPELKNIDPTLPVVMITKSEEEHIMEDAIGSKIADYLIKPVNPNQILLTIKKNLDEKRLVSEKATSGYRQEFRDIAMRLGDRMDPEEWADFYKKLVYWSMELQGSDDEGMSDIFRTQRMEANEQFSRFIRSSYLGWLKNSSLAPVMSHTLVKQRVAPVLKENPTETVFMVVIDNLRWDQWRTIMPRLKDYFRVDQEEIFYSILPTATHYARNALFSGLMPSEMERVFPQLWKSEEDEGGKNLHEEEFLAAQLKRLGFDLKWSYNKITNIAAGKKLADSFSNLMNNRLNVIVYNFVDMLSHARTEMEVIKELADDEPAYRSITQSWFDHSPLLDILKQVAEKKCRLVITTDHGTVRVENPVKVVGDKNTNTNLRYKAGKNLSYNPKEVFEIRNPSDGFLPKSNVSTSYIFAMNNDFFVYPNNYNHFVNYYQNTFQHGGISMEEVLIPFVLLSPK
ncbi:MAG: bifunctional response regulator/alkaline phosphatase family protein [Crocinitomicaceae bacterium]|nr:bifunctional response regulator/alkaline phosphatase family protein [Crocinitomicaceae bacterium]